MVTPLSDLPPERPLKRPAPLDDEPADTPIESVTRHIIRSAPSAPRSETSGSSAIHNLSDITSSVAPAASMSMKEFVNSLNVAPLSTYMSLVEEINLHGVNFPFRPYRETLETIQAYLSRRSNFSSSSIAQGLHKSISEELKKSPEPGFSSASSLIYKFIHHYPGRPNDDDSDDDDSYRGYDRDSESTCIPSEGFKAIKYNADEGIIVLSYITPAELDLNYFVNARSVPVYAFGLGAGRDIIPPPYDGEKNDGRRNFFDHDADHTRAMETSGNKKEAGEMLQYFSKRISEMEKAIKDNDIGYISAWANESKLNPSDLDGIKTFLFKEIDKDKHRYKELEYLYNSMSSKIPLVAHAMRLQRYNKRLREAPQEMQKPIEAVAFFLFHENGGGPYRFDPSFINKDVIFAHLRDNNEYVRALPLEQTGFGIRKTLDKCLYAAKELLQHYAYPPEYMTWRVINKLPEAREWMFNFLNEERLYQESEAGHREENSPEQQEVDELMKSAAQKINEAL